MNIIPLCEEWLPKVVELERSCFSKPWTEQSFRDVMADPLFSFRLLFLFLIDLEVALSSNMKPKSHRRMTENAKMDSRTLPSRPAPGP